MSELSFQDWAASYYVKKGVPPEMMNIGMGVYGRSFTLSSPSNHDVGAPTRGAGDSGQFTGEKGFISYYEVFNATSNNISVISWWSVLMVEKTRENHRPAVGHCQT
jgi:chitinase